MTTNQFKLFLVMFCNINRGKTFGEVIPDIHSHRKRTIIMFEEFYIYNSYYFADKNGVINLRLNGGIIEYPKESDNPFKWTPLVSLKSLIDFDIYKDIVHN